jgi:hypothetical protein
MEGVLCRTVKPVAVGPKGWEGVSWTSEAMTEVPLAVCEVVTSRAGGRDAIVLSSKAIYSFCTLSCFDMVRN